MAHRLRILIPRELETRIREAADRCGLSKGEWVRRALEEALVAPTGDVDRVIAEIEAGRR